MAYDASAAKSIHPAFTVSPRARASIPQQTAPTRATTTQIPYRRRPLFIAPPALPWDLTEAYASYHNGKSYRMRRPTARVENTAAYYPVTASRTLRTLGEEPRGGETGGACEKGADDGWVDEDLQRGRGRSQAEDRLHRVVRVGEGDQASERLENTRRMLVAEETRDVDQGE